MSDKFYTGVGSRDLPMHVRRFLRVVGVAMAEKGYTLRSGGADGADAAFELGAVKGKGGLQIWLPWDGFNDRFISSCYDVPTKQMFEQAKRTLEANVIPWYSNMKQGAQKLHGRNFFQVHGYEVEDNSLVCLYACKEDKHGEPTGGTRTAVKLAENAGVPCYNLIHEEVRIVVAKKLNIKL